MRVEILRLRMQIVQLRFRLHCGQNDNASHERCVAFAQKVVDRLTKLDGKVQAKLSELKACTPDSTGPKCKNADKKIEVLTQGRYASAERDPEAAGLAERQELHRLELADQRLGTRPGCIEPRSGRSRLERLGPRYGPGMAFLAVPGPFDLALTTERFRAFGVDNATLWHEGGLYRAVGGSEVRIEAAPGGVDVEPLTTETEPVVRAVLGLAFDLEAFYAWAADDEVLGPCDPRFAGFRPSLAPDPFEMLVGAITAQQVSLFSAVAIRNRCIERFGAQVGHVWAFPTARANRGGDARTSLFALGFSRRQSGVHRRARALRPRPP